MSPHDLSACPEISSRGYPTSFHCGGEESLSPVCSSTQRLSLQSDLRLAFFIGFSCHDDIHSPSPFSFRVPLKFSTRTLPVI